MGADETTRSNAEPAVWYSERLIELKSAQAADQAQERRLGQAKVADCVCHDCRCRASLSTTSNSFGCWSCLRPVLPFWQCCMRSGFNGCDYDSARLSSTSAVWRAFRIDGRELERRGKGSLIRRIRIEGSGSLWKGVTLRALCTARTRAGEEKLAEWLLAAAPVEEIVARHGAIHDLKARVKLREELFCVGETVHAGVHPDSLARWGSANLFSEAHGYALQLQHWVHCGLQAWWRGVRGGSARLRWLFQH